jgi:hypothetical protein
MKKDSLFENAAAHPLPTAHGLVEETSEYKDSNPRLNPAPTGARSATFYMEKKLAV